MLIIYNKEKTVICKLFTQNVYKETMSSLTQRKDLLFIHVLNSTCIYFLIKQASQPRSQGFLPFLYKEPPSLYQNGKKPLERGCKFLSFLSNFSFH